jgi:hypothetical protein
VAGLKLRSKGIADIAELDSALMAMKQSGSTALIVQPGPLTYLNRERIIASTMKNGMGIIFGPPGRSERRFIDRVWPRKRPDVPPSFALCGPYA